METTLGLILQAPPNMVATPAGLSFWQAISIVGTLILQTVAITSFAVRISSNVSHMRERVDELAEDMKNTRHDSDDTRTKMTQIATRVSTLDKTLTETKERTERTGADVNKLMGRFNGLRENRP